MQRGSEDQAEKPLSQPTRGQSTLARTFECLGGIAPSREGTELRGINECGQFIGGEDPTNFKGCPPQDLTSA